MKALKSLLLIPLLPVLLLAFFTDMFAEAGEFTPRRAMTNRILDAVLS